MAMTARLWSISALAVELGVDRRTVGKRLARVPPDGRLNGSPAWRLTTALEAVRPDPRPAPRRAHGSPPAPEPPPPPPPGGEMLAGADGPADLGFGIAALLIVYELPRLAAVCAVEAGVPIGRAFELSGLMAAVVAHFVQGRAAEAGLEPWASGEDRVRLATRAFTPVNWPSLAVKAGEPGWAPPRPLPGWPGLSAAERAACVRHGEGEDARHAAEPAAAR
jgi:hypothetical protein